MRLRYTRAFSTACKTSDIFKNQKRPQWRFATGRCGHRPLRNRCRAGSYGSRTQHASPFATKGGCASRTVTTHPRRYAHVGASIARPRYNPPNCSTPMQIRTRLGCEFASALCYRWPLLRTSDARPYTRIRTRREDGARTDVRTYGTF